ncbi:Vitamin B12 import ATP-binding protein BtuD [Streptomyces alboniger]
MKVDWIAGGHDGGDRERGRVEERVTTWFDRYLKDDQSTGTGPAFRISRTGGMDSTDGAARLRGASSDRYPGLESDPRAVPLGGREQTFDNPAGANPPAISGLPGIGAGNLSQMSSLGVGVSLDVPGQYAKFDSEPLREDLRVTGTPTARVHVKSTSEDAVLFAKVYDVGPGGKQRVLPSQFVAPVRVEGTKAGKDVELRLPAVDHEVRKGHRLRLVLASTDLGYASPVEPAEYTVALKGDLEVPTAPGVRTAAAPMPAWVWWLPAAGAVIALALLVTGRRRTTAPAPDPELAEVPLQITDLSKRYAKSSDRYAVRDVSFRVEKGQVLGLLGPNGAGKTTTLRMLMGLIRPDAGEIRVFGQAIRPGAPVLSRVGAFVEGAGFLPHLSGRENLELYWKATGRPAEDAHLDEALEIAGLGTALARAVRTYSQGMRQRLAIAQAMLGMPDLLILDEPTNGLDPPQIREMREVMIRYARGGRTVIVSSHLLAEVEQSCTHLVVMDRGRLVQAGPVTEIVGSGDTLLVGLAQDVPDPLVEKVAALPGVASAVRADDGLLVRLDGTEAGTAVRLLPELGAPRRARTVHGPAPPPGRRVPDPDRRRRRMTATATPERSTAPGYRAGRTLPLRVEAVRQLKRRRTLVMGAVMALLPVVLVIAFAVGGSPESRGGRVSLMDTATASGANFAATALFVLVVFLLVIPVALFCGDTVASEASWSSLAIPSRLPCRGPGCSGPSSPSRSASAPPRWCCCRWWRWRSARWRTAGGRFRSRPAARFPRARRCGAWRSSWRTSSSPNWSPRASRSGCRRGPTPRSARSAARSA